MLVERAGAKNVEFGPFRKNCHIILTCVSEARALRSPERKQEGGNSGRQGKVVTGNSGQNRSVRPKVENHSTEIHAEFRRRRGCCAGDRATYVGGEPARSG
jgi:hypothetical protein